MPSQQQTVVFSFATTCFILIPDDCSNGYPVILRLPLITTLREFLSSLPLPFSFYDHVPCFGQFIILNFVKPCFTRPAIASQGVSSTFSSSSHHKPNLLDSLSFIKYVTRPVMYWISLFFLLCLMYCLIMTRM